jgi:hypothetical protein
MRPCTQNHHLLGICFQAGTSITIALQMGDFNAVVGIVIPLPDAIRRCEVIMENPTQGKPTWVGAWRTEQLADVEPDFACGSGLLSLHRQFDRGGLLDAAPVALHRNRVGPSRRI